MYRALKRDARAEGGRSHDSFRDSLMPRHLMRDAYEWINEISTVLIKILVNLQATERICMDTAGKEDSFEVDSILDL